MGADGPPAESGRSATSRTTAGLVGLVAGLAVYDWVRELIAPGHWQVAANLGAGVAVGMWAWWTRCTAAELGLDRQRLASGLRWGGAAVLVVTAVVVAGALLPASGAAFTDDRAEVPASSLLFAVLVEVPFGTVLVEELAFRGVLLGLARRRWATVPAVLMSSVLFGLWHVPGAMSVAAGEAGSALVEQAGGPATVVGTVAATSVAGIVFAWLRLRADSLLAPVLAHLSTNTVALVAAWVLTRSA